MVPLPPSGGRMGALLLTRRLRPMGHAILRGLADASLSAQTVCLPAVIGLRLLKPRSAWGGAGASAHAGHKWLPGISE